MTSEQPKTLRLVMPQWQGGDNLKTWFGCWPGLRLKATGRQWMCLFLRPMARRLRSTTGSAIAAL